MMTEASFWALRDLVNALNTFKETGKILQEFEKINDKANVKALKKHFERDMARFDSAAKDFVETYNENDLKKSAG